MHAHTPEFFEGQCIKATTGVMPDPTKVGDNAEFPCDITEPACQASTAQFAPFAKRLPQVGVRGGIHLKHDSDPKSAAARVYDTYRNLIQGHLDPWGRGQMHHACNTSHASVRPSAGAHACSSVPAPAQMMLHA